eukprot:5177500-Prymnesium_polylepis.1
MVRLCAFERVVCVTYNTPKRYCPPCVVKCDIVRRRERAASPRTAAGVRERPRVCERARGRERSREAARGRERPREAARGEAAREYAGSRQYAIELSIHTL